MARIMPTGSQCFVTDIFMVFSPRMLISIFAILSQHNEHSKVKRFGVAVL
jgi:hypothetical protein